MYFWCNNSSILYNHNDMVYFLIRRPFFKVSSVLSILFYVRLLFLPIGFHISPSKQRQLSAVDGELDIFHKSQNSLYNLGIGRWVNFFNMVFLALVRKGFHYLTQASISSRIFLILTLDKQTPPEGELVGAETAAL